MTAPALWGIVESPKGWPHITATQSRRPRSGIVIHRGGLATEDVAIAPVRVTWAQLHRDADALESEIRAALGHRRGFAHARGG